MGVMVGAILWNSPGRWPLVFAAICVVCAGVAWLYPRQVAGLPRGMRWVLPGLRVAAMGVLALALMRPVLVRPATEAERGAVVVMVDDSESSGVVDTTRTSAQLLTLAQGLGWVPARATEEVPPPPVVDLGDVREAMEDVLRSREEINYAELTGRDTEAPRQRLDDASERYLSAVRWVYRQLPTSRPASLADALASLGNVPGEPGGDEWEREVRARLRHVGQTQAALRQSAEERLLQTNGQVRALCEKLAGESRLGLAETVLCEPGTGLLDRLPKSVPVYGFAIGDGVKPLPLRGDGGASVRRLLVKADGTSSDISGALGAVRKAMGGERVQAMVLLSDGRQVGGTASLVTTVAGAVPVFTVPLAARVASPDVAIARVSMPGAAWAGETVNMDVDVRAAGVRGVVDVRLSSAGGQELSNAVKFDADRTVRTTFAVKVIGDGGGGGGVGGGGGQEVRVSAAPAAAAPGTAAVTEVSLANNVVTRTLKVMGERVAVLALAGGPSWDFQYLRNALGNEPGVALTAEIAGNGGGVSPVAIAPAEIEKQDVIVLDDFPKAGLSDVQWAAVKRAVEERGAAAFLIAGRGHLPAEYVESPVAEWLPFEGGAAGAAWHVWPGEEPGYYVVPAPGARALEALQLETGGRWPALPGVFRYFGGERLRPAARALLVDRDSQTPVLTESRAGRGRAFFVGVDETWRWRWKVGGRYDDRLWTQLVRYAAPEPYAVVNGDEGLDVRRPRITAGQVLHVRVRTSGGEAAGAAAPVARVLREGKEVATVALVSEGIPGRYEGTVRGLAAGAYEVRSGALGMNVTVEPRGEAEREDLSGDERFLRRIADATGGDVVPLELAGTLPGRIVRAGESRMRVKETSLWDGPYLYALVIAALTAEWAVRKQYGLA